MNKQLIAAGLPICSALMSVPAQAATTPEQFNVRDFGGIGTGIADDQPAINKQSKQSPRTRAGCCTFRTAPIARASRVRRMG